jgi:hypothetical protein
MLPLFWGKSCVVTVLLLGVCTQGRTYSCMSWSVRMVQNIHCLYSQALNCCLCILVMSEEDGVHG